MHIFLLIFCVFAEALILTILIRQNTRGIGSLNERFDLLFAETGKLNLDSRVSELEKWAREISLLTPDIRSIRNLAMAHADLVRQFSIINSGADLNLKSIRAMLDTQAEALNIFKEKLADLAEGCVKVDSNLATLTEDVKQLAAFRQSDIAEMHGNLERLNADLEKTRHRSGQSGTPPGFGSVVKRAEAGSRNKTSELHDKLVALAQGPPE